jgi:hypothetical protein
MSVMTERRYAGEHILSEAPGYRSRDTVVIAASQNLKAGQVLGMVSIGALSVALTAEAGNTGNGAAPTITAAAGTPPGVYKMRIIEPGTNAGSFVISDPGGVDLGHGTVGVAFNIGGLSGTFPDGGTDYAAGDAWSMGVTDATHAEEGQYKAHNPVATDGTQVACAILFDAVVTPAGKTEKAVVHNTDCEVKADLLGWNGHNTGQKNAALADLLKQGVKARA